MLALVCAWNIHGDVEIVYNDSINLTYCIIHYLTFLYSNFLYLQSKETYIINYRTAVLFLSNQTKSFFLRSEPIIHIKQYQELIHT